MIQWCETPRPRDRRPARHRLDGQGLLGQGDGVAWLDRHDGGADLDAGGLRRHHGGRRQGVEVIGDLGDPHRGQAGLLGPPGIGPQPFDLGGVAASLRPDHHADAHRDLPGPWVRMPFFASVISRSANPPAERRAAVGLRTVAKPVEPEAPSAAAFLASSETRRSGVPADRSGRRGPPVPVLCPLRVPAAAAIRTRRRPTCPSRSSRRWGRRPAPG